MVPKAIDTENRSPIISFYQLVRPRLMAQMSDQSWRSESRIDLSNYLSSTSKNDEYYFIDGESTYYTQTLRYQHNLWQFGLRLNYVSHDRGFLDRAIYDFHDLFSMPQNGRVDDAHDLFMWQLEARGQNLINANSSSSALGDTSLIASRALTSNQSLSAQIKIPTGSLDELSGSEAWDAGISYSHFNPDWLTSRNWLNQFALGFWWGIGLNYLSTADSLALLKENHWVLTAATGFTWNIVPAWQVQLQFDTNSPLFDSPVRELGWVPLQTSIGLNYSIDTNRELQAVIIEDLRPRATPDVIFSLGYQHNF